MVAFKSATSWLECPHLISEKRFCAAYGSLWQALTPTCDRFVRQINQGLSDRIWRPMASAVAANRRGLINEVAFQLFVGEMRAHATGNPPMAIETVVHSVSNRLSQIDLSKSNLDERLTEDERQDIREQLGRLRQLFVRRLDVTIVIEPMFPGCGFVDTCRGDVIQMNTLYEVKAGERSFRSIDLRQLVTYATLNYVSKAYRLENAAVVNLRSGLLFEIPLDELAQQISGLHSNELFETIAYSLASGDMSR